MRCCCLAFPIIVGRLYQTPRHGVYTFCRFFRRERGRLQHEVIRKNAEGKNGFTRTDENFRPSDCAHVFRASEGDGGSSAWETVAPLRHFNRCELSRSVSRAEQSGMERLRRSDIDGKPRGTGERVERRTNQFIAKCGDALREIEEWSMLGNRDIDGKTREVAGELLGKQRIKAPTGWNCSCNPGSSARKNSLCCAKSAKN